MLVITHDIRDLLSRAGFVFWGGFIGSVAACDITIKLKKLNFVRHQRRRRDRIAGRLRGRTNRMLGGGRRLRPAVERAARGRVPRGSSAVDGADMQALFGIQPPPGAPADALLAVYPTQLFETVLGLRDVPDPVALPGPQARRGLAVRRSTACWRASSASSSSSSARRTTGSSGRSRRRRRSGWRWRR